MDLLCLARYVSFCCIYFICQKSSHRFLPIFVSVIENIVLIEFIKIKSGGHRARLRENEHLSRYRAYFEGNLLRFVRARAHLRALMTQKSCAVGMRNAKLGNHLKVSP